jgi:hypothetical protein
MAGSSLPLPGGLDALPFDVSKIPCLDEAVELGVAPTARAGRGAEVVGAVGGGHSGSSLDGLTLNLIG